ncbi:DUF6083 domain-containing protein [Streptomyces sp. NPDC102490]|uniref:DUF6083 domain-containing protein n=1 Tax=Streptomyces sp. NPDC102490 TaxID=3366183 RepID=UPI003814B29D
MHLPRLAPYHQRTAAPEAPSEKEPRGLSGGQSPSPVCELSQDRAPTHQQDWTLLKPDTKPVAHTVPADHRWIELPDGRATADGACPPAQSQRCRIEHHLTCPAQPLPDPWPRLTPPTSRKLPTNTTTEHPVQPPPPEKRPHTG